MAVGTSLASGFDLSGMLGGMGDSLGGMMDGLFGGGAQPNLMETVGLTQEGLAGMDSAALKDALTKMEIAKLGQGAEGFSLFDMVNKGANLFGDVNSMMQGNQLFSKNMDLLKYAYC